MGNRVLHYSSFTPFVIVFLYTVLSNSMENVNLLSEVIEVLQGLQTVSRSSKRLFESCSTLWAIAKNVVGNRQSTDAMQGLHDRQEDSVQWSELWSESFEAALATSCDGAEVESMQALLTDLANEEYFPLNLSGNP